MDSSNYKFYLEDGFGARQNLERYLSDKPEMVFGEDSISFLLENLTKTFAEGHNKGDLLIELSAGSTIRHLYPVCEFFKHIIVLKTNDRCIMELKRRVDAPTGALEWDHAAKHLAVIKGNSDQSQEKHGKVRSALRQVMKCDLEKENIVDPIVLPPADCIMMAWFMEVASKNQYGIENYFRRVRNLLKPSGQLIIYWLLDGTHMIAGNDKFHLLTSNEDFVRNTVEAEGFVIDRCEVKKRTAVDDLSDYKGMMFIAAHKK